MRFTRRLVPSRDNGGDGGLGLGARSERGGWREECCCGTAGQWVSSVVDLNSQSLNQSYTRVVYSSIAVVVVVVEGEDETAMVLEVMKIRALRWPLKCPIRSVSTFSVHRIGVVHLRAM